MKKRFFSVITVLGLILNSFAVSYAFDFDALTVLASETTDQGISIENEYVIPDGFDWCTYYVIVARNNTGKDISISADFTALDKKGNVLGTVNDYSEAVKKDQEFILYGQFKNSEIAGIADYKYDFSVADTDNCTYSSVDIDTEKIGECIQVSATNYSEHDIQGIGVRTVFLRNGKPVAFDTVNIADVGYTFHGGSTNSQVVGHNAGQYDNFILTYTSAGNGVVLDF